MCDDLRGLATEFKSTGVSIGTPEVAGVVNGRSARPASLLVTRLGLVELSIKERLFSDGSKAYLRNLATHGYEMGVGYPGAYDAHAHRGFTDVAFAPGGLTINGQPGLLHITPPGVWFGPIVFHSEFWFVKFFQSESDRCAVPDKITDRAEVSRSWCAVTSEFCGTFPSDMGRDISLQIVERRLVVGGLDGPDSELVVGL